MTVRRLTADDWALYSDIRLSALRADPGAFASTYQHEIEFDEATWRQRLTAGPDGRPVATFVDEQPDVADPLGTAAIVYTEHHPAPMLVAMWVRSEARGRGSGRRLVDAAVAWAADRGEAEVVLWVVHDNTPAIELYRSCGFVASGRVEALPSNPCADELEMVKPLSLPV